MSSEETTSTSFFRELPLLLVSAVLIAWTVRTFIFQPFYIPSGSMEPTLYPRDRVIVNKFIYRFSEPKRGDIIVFLPPNDNRDYIKRIIGLPGETLEIKKGVVYINQQQLSEPYKIKQPDLTNFGPFKIPPSNYFVMGDNRPNSSDSRVFGPLRKERIIGRAVLIYWPLSRLRWLR